MMQDMNEIIPFLFLGNRKSLELHHNKFSMIINCTPDIPFPDSYNSCNSCENCIRLCVKDDPFESVKLYQLIKETNVLEQIHNKIINSQNVLVHCSMGVQRSCAVVGCYLIKYYNLTPNEAIKYIKTKRPIAFFGQVNFRDTLEVIYKNSICNTQNKI